MLFKPLLILSAALASLVAAKDVDVSVKFPDTNPFGKVINGGSNNVLQVRLANHAGEQLTLSRVYGSYQELEGKRRQLRNTTTLQLQQPILSGLASPLIPYKFHCENKIGEVGLKVWIDYLDSGNKVHTVLGYDGAVTVVEPEGSWLDLQLIFLYLLLISFFSFLLYQFYLSYTSPSSSSSSTKTKRTPRPTPAPTPVSPDGKAYDDEWIPKDHLKQRVAKSGGATSGEESEAGSGAGTPRKRKGGRK